MLINKKKFCILAAFCLLSLNIFSQHAKPKLNSTYKYVNSGRYRTYPVTTEKKIFDAFGPGEKKEFNDSFSAADVKGLIKGYVTRIEKKCINQFKASEELIRWFENNLKAREAFWLALDEQYDDIAVAINIFDTLRKKNPDKIIKYYHLAVAIAVVWDSPDAVSSSRWSCIWGYQVNQFLPLLKYEEVFDYFTNPKYQRLFVFKPDKLRWPLMTHLVDFDLSKKEYIWSLKNYNSKKRKIQTTYKDVKYDYQKLQTRSPIVRGEYTLQNLLRLGGICGDQSHFASRIAKCFGIPSMKVSGMGRHGGSGHAWAGYLIGKKGRPALEFTGRYRGDFYYTGDVFNPQTRTLGMERFVALMYDGASLNYSKYIDSLALAKIAQKIKVSDPKLSVNITKEALALNYYCGPAWVLLMDHVYKGTADRKVGVKWFNLMTKKLKAHPDLTILCFNSFMRCIPKEEVKTRSRYYNILFTMYKNRPDLQIQLRCLQCRELADADKALKGLTLAIQTCIDNGKEGGLLLPLVKICVEIAKEKKLEEKVKPYMKKIKFPMKRGNKISQSYTEFKKLLNSL
ncbi:MAG: hypothetical protein COA79_13100 [Planctomycetota bacterium]|nr:MAG: hypothetical protein COA79_13100 [Planctomycetota bacterium]